MVNNENIVDKGETKNGIKYECDDSYFRIFFADINASINIKRLDVGKKFFVIHMQLPCGLGELTGKETQGIERLDGYLECGMFDETADVLAIVTLNHILAHSKAKLAEWCFTEKEIMIHDCHQKMMGTWAELKKEYIFAESGVMISA